MSDKSVVTAYIVFIGVWWPLLFIAAFGLFFWVKKFRNTPLVKQDVGREKKENRFTLYFLVLLFICIVAFTYFEYSK